MLDRVRIQRIADVEHATHESHRAAVLVLDHLADRESMALGAIRRDDSVLERRVLPSLERTGYRLLDPRPVFGMERLPVGVVRRWRRRQSPDLEQRLVPADRVLGDVPRPHPDTGGVDGETAGFLAIGDFTGQPHGIGDVGRDQRERFDVAGLADRNGANAVDVTRVPSSADARTS